MNLSVFEDENDCFDVCFVYVLRCSIYRVKIMNLKKKKKSDR